MKYRVLLLQLVAVNALGGQVPREPIVTLTRIETEDAELVTRFAESEKISSIASHGVATDLQLYCSQSSADRLLSDFQKSLGFRPRFGQQHRGLNQPSLPFPRLALSVDSPMRAAEFWHRFHVVGLLPSAYRALLAARSVGAADKISSCAYILRPWITDKMTRTDCVEGTFEVVSTTGSREVYFQYCDPD